MYGNGNPNFQAAGSAEAILAVVRKRQAAEAEQCRACGEIWDAFALSHGLVSTSDDPRGTRRLEGTVNDVDVEVAIVVGDDGWRHTQVVADAKVPVDGVVTVLPSPHGILDVVKQALFGKEDVRVGDADFDRRHLVHSEPRGLAPQMLDEAARTLIHAWAGNSLEAIQYDRGRVYVQSAGVETDPTALGCALAIAVRLAAFQSGAHAIYR